MAGRDGGEGFPEDVVECLVCSDAGVPMRVLGLEAGDALCIDDRGDTWMVAVDYVMPVEIGETLLVHGGSAIGRVVRTIDESSEEPFVERRDMERRPWAQRDLSLHPSNPPQATGRKRL